MAHDDQSARGLAREFAAFGDLAREVMLQLSKRTEGVDHNKPRPHIMEQLNARMTARSTFDASATLDELRGFNLSDQSIIDCYIPASAAQIGERWVQSDMGFAEVTIATVRLQSLLNEVAYSNPVNVTGSTASIDALIVTLEGEQHTLGSFVAAAQLRRRGANVEVTCGDAPDTIEEMVLAGDYDLIMFSCSRSQDLETIARVIRNLRYRLQRAPIFALGGIVLGICRNLERLTKADLVTSDIDQVVEWCTQRPGHAKCRAAR